MPTYAKVLKVDHKNKRVAVELSKEFQTTLVKVFNASEQHFGTFKITKIEPEADNNSGQWLTLENMPKKIREGFTLLQ